MLYQFKAGVGTRNALTSVLVAFAVVLLGTAPALAVELKPTDGGAAVAPENGEVTIDDTAPGGGIGPLAVVNVGGGTWNYGSGTIWNPLPRKSCWSNYVHPTKYHSSTAIIASNNVKRYATAGNWSNASTYSGFAYTCYAYWAKY